MKTNYDIDVANYVRVMKSATCTVKLFLQEYSRGKSIFSCPISYESVSCHRYGFPPHMYVCILYSSKSTSADKRDHINKRIDIKDIKQFSTVMNRQQSFVKVFKYTLMMASIFVSWILRIVFDDPYEYCLLVVNRSLVCPISLVWILTFIYKNLDIYLSILLRIRGLTSQHCTSAKHHFNIEM